jgi:hypothetical protein
MAKTKKNSIMLFIVIIFVITIGPIIASYTHIHEGFSPSQYTGRISPAVQQLQATIQGTITSSEPISRSNYSQITTIINNSLSPTQSVVYNITYTPIANSSDLNFAILVTGVNSQLLTSSANTLMQSLQKSANQITQQLKDMQKTITGITNINQVL